jgi:hypothetical protein
MYVGGKTRLGGKPQVEKSIRKRRLRLVRGFR